MSNTPFFQFDRDWNANVDPERLAWQLVVRHLENGGRLIAMQREAQQNVDASEPGTPRYIFHKAIWRKVMEFIGEILNEMDARRGTTAGTTTTGTTTAETTTPGTTTPGTTTTGPASTETCTTAETTTAGTTNAGTTAT